MCHLFLHSSLIISAAFSPIIIITALVCPATILGIIDPSTTLSPLIPYTLSWASTTASGSVSGPILHVPTWCPRVVAICRTAQAQYESLPNGTFLQPGTGILFKVALYFWKWRDWAMEIACKSEKCLVKWSIQNSNGSSNVQRRRVCNYWMFVVQLDLI